MNNMVSHFILSFILSVAVLCLRLQAQQHSTNPYLGSTNLNLVEKACQTAPDKTFCLSILQADRTSPKADMKGLAFITLRAAEKNASATSLFLKITLDKSQTDMQPAVEDAVSNCNEHYLTAIELIEDSINALVSDKPDDVNKFMGAAVADLDACDASVKGQPGAAADVADRNVALRRIIDASKAVFLVSQTS